VEGSPLNVVRKLAYYRNDGMPSGLARMYFAHFDGARKVLDVGCGTGALGRYRPSPDIEVHGVDIDAGAVELAAQHEAAVRLDLDREPLPYPDETFDAVLAKDIFEHVRQPGPLAREIHRVMIPGGVLIASVVMDKPSAVWADYTHVRGFSRRAARTLLEDAGFTVERVWPMGGVPLSNRLHLMPLVPYVLRLPPFSQIWASSWELRARK